MKILGFYPTKEGAPTFKIRNEVTGQIVLETPSVEKSIEYLDLYTKSLDEQLANLDKQIAELNAIQNEGEGWKDN